MGRSSLKRAIFAVDRASKAAPQPIEVDGRGREHLNYLDSSAAPALSKPVRGFQLGNKLACNHVASSNNRIDGRIETLLKRLWWAHFSSIATGSIILPQK